MSTNNIKAGTRVTMVGELGEFTYYVNHLLEGEKLKEAIQRQKSAGWKFPSTDPRSEFQLLGPKPVAGTDMEDENVKAFLKYLKEKKIYTDKDGVVRLNCVKKKRLPLFGVLNAETGRIKEIRPTGTLDPGQIVQVEFTCFSTDKGNNGISVNTVVFLEEPKMQEALPNWDRLDDGTQKAPTPKTNGDGAGAGAGTAPAETTADEDGFVPVEEDEVMPW